MIPLFQLHCYSFLDSLRHHLSKICWSSLPAPKKQLLRLFMDGLQVDFSLFFGAFTSGTDMCVIERDLDEWTDFFWNWLFTRPHSAKTNVTKVWNHFHSIYLVAYKGGLISEQISLRLKSQKKRKVPHYDPEHLLFRWKVIRVVIWHIFFGGLKWKTFWD